MMTKMVIDKANSTDNRIYIDTAIGTFCCMQNEDGLACDIYPLQVSDGPSAACWAAISDLIEGE